MVMVLFIRKFVADMLACASNLLHIKCYLRKLRDEFSISAIIFSRYATHRIPYMMENLSMVLHGSLCRLWHGDSFTARPGGYEDRLEQDMKKDTTERVRKAQDKALESLDYILETIPAPDFVEIVGRVGGDTVTYRVYNDGSVYER